MPGRRQLCEVGFGPKPLRFESGGGQGDVAVGWSFHGHVWFMRGNGRQTVGPVSEGAGERGTGSTAQVCGMGVGQPIKSALSAALDQVSKSVSPKLCSIPRAPTRRGR